MSSFPLLRLPQVPLFDILQQWDMMELLELSMISKRACSLVKKVRNTNTKILWIDRGFVNLREFPRTSNIDNFYDKYANKYGEEFIRYYRITIHARKQMSVEKMRSAVEKLKTMEYCIFDSDNHSTFKHYFHESFERMHYLEFQYAKWLDFSHLMWLRNETIALTLRCTSISSKDLNNFLIYWQKDPKQRETKLKHIKMGGLRIDEVLKDLTVFPSSSLKQPEKFITFNGNTTCVEGRREIRRPNGKIIICHFGGSHVDIYIWHFSNNM